MLGGCCVQLGDRFCVGSTSRYTPGQADDTAMPVEVGAEMEKTGTKRPASVASLRDEDAHPAPQDNSSAVKRDGPSGEGGYPCGRPSVSSRAEVKRRNRWTQGLLVGSTSPPQGVDPPSTPSNRTTSPARQRAFDAVEASGPQSTSKPRPQGPLAVKSKAAKVAKPTPSAQQGTEQPKSVPEQGLLHALHARLQTPPSTSAGLLSMVPARPATTGAANPQMPAPCKRPRHSHSTRHNCPHHGNIPPGGGRAVQTC